MFPKTALFALLALFLLSGTACKTPASSSGLPEEDLDIAGHKARVEIANTEPTRMTGLMFRSQMDKDHGMLFVFPDAQTRAFWMKNTEIPLSIAFFDAHGVILNVLEMPAETEQSFFSAGPAKFALEMNTGWFENNHVQAGVTVSDVLKAPPAGQ